jgi:hypothetical protein
MATNAERRVSLAPNRRSAKVLRRFRFRRGSCNFVLPEVCRQPGVTDEINEAYHAQVAMTRPVQESQKKLLRWLVKYHDVKRVA